jgi:hypothetical protein
VARLTFSLTSKGFLKGARNGRISKFRCGDLFPVVVQLACEIWSCYGQAPGVNLRIGVFIGFGGGGRSVPMLLFFGHWGFG